MTADVRPAASEATGMFVAETTSRNTSSADGPAATAGKSVDDDGLATVRRATGGGDRAGVGRFRISGSNPAIPAALGKLDQL
jgi:hypothetical protein